MNNSSGNDCQDITQHPPPQCSHWPLTAEWIMDIGHYWGLAAGCSSHALASYWSSRLSSRSVIGQDPHGVSSESFNAGRG